MPSERNPNWSSIAVLGTSILVALALGATRELQKPPPKDPAPYEMAIPQYRTRDQAERAAVQALRKMLAVRPNASQYVVNYVYDGKHVGGVVPKVLSYNPQERRLQDVFETTGIPSLRVENLGKSEIVTVARKGGRLSDLKRAAAAPAARESGNAPRTSRHREQR